MSARILVASLLILFGSVNAGEKDKSSVFLDTVNLVENPGFERIEAEGAAVGWNSPDGGNTHKAHSIAKDAPRDGSHCATIEKGNRKRWAVWSQDVEVTGNQKYRIGGWVKVKGGSLASVAVFFFDAEGTRVGVEGVGQKGETDWTHMAKEIKSPPAATRGRLHCGVLHEGQVWFDEIMLEPLQNPVPQPLAHRPYYPGIGGIKNVKIDGKLDEWKNQPWLELGARQHLQAAEAVYEPDDIPWEGPKDLSAEVALAWDAKDLYLAVDAVDDRFPVSGEYYWKGDSIQFAVDTGHEKSPEPDDNDYEVGVGLAQNGTRAFIDFKPAGSNLQPKHIKSAVKKTEKGYSVEVAVPWKNLGISDISKRPTIGYSFLINDNDGEGRKWLEWGSGIGMTKDPSKYAALHLLPAGKPLHLHFPDGKRAFPADSRPLLSARMDVFEQLSQKVQVDLSLHGKDGTKVADSAQQTTLGRGTWKYYIPLDTTDLKPGDYALRAAVLNPGKETLAEDSITISIIK